MRLGRILIFPVKSLDGIQLDEVTITKGGILENDRVYAIFDEQGRVVNGKRTALVHELRCEFDPGFKEIRFWKGDAPVQFCLDALSTINRWLSEFFDFSVVLKHNPTTGFPDDEIAFGPTIVSEASLRMVQEWFPELSIGSVRHRFRTNLELVGGKPFCEDQLYGAPEVQKAFRIGDVSFIGHNPCQRCVVPTRDPLTGAALSGFQKRFMEMRRQMFPEWADAKRFSHYYRFAVNTSIPGGEAGKKLRVGDPVVL
ncbi:MAG TPA: MOSC N-terminal beta barrel domain-containing protein [Chthoniobacterales bacterium]|jgi:uncharacterized protein YcbX|nr:MOSC N-terminal beta barrel domain-containing protein [Chthoniobacterales bacterium]